MKGGRSPANKLLSSRMVAYPGEIFRLSSATQWLLLFKEPHTTYSAHDLVD